ncbi:chemotaxis protein CheX [Lignipirellula cremea]|uniref:CheY-P phosphatase CheX n=1 Tax=Lignipirellula cremea TaxID=2528010 RepID=A0A518DUC7_9BACT|nr:chemotaxis protein CheX [Lignipirellula cremea]QDU95434.1 CheY-P phosphatase CheX [Lignipirellula cremea]
MTTQYAPVDVEFINPFVVAATKVFNVMLGCELKRGPLFLKNNTQPDFEISGVIGLSGKASGTVVLSLQKEVALSLTEVLLEKRPEHLDADVVDAIGELTNMVAGNAKTRLEQFQISLGLPSVIIGKNHSVEFPRGIAPIGIPFQSRLGPVCLVVGLCEQAAFAPV